MELLRKDGLITTKLP